MQQQANMAAIGPVNERSNVGKIKLQKTQYASTWEALLKTYQLAFCLELQWRIQSNICG